MELPISRLGEEVARIVHRKRRAFRFTQADVGQRVGVSGSYVSSLENAKTSPRLSELEGMALLFRTTAMELLTEAQHACEGFVPIAPEHAPRAVQGSLDELADGLGPETRRLAREFLIFLRERERERERGGGSGSGSG